MDSAAGGSLGAAQGEITLSADGALRALNQVSAGLKNLDSQSRTQGSGLLSWASSNEQAINTIGTGLLGVGATFLGAFGLATNTAANFEQQMSAVGSVTGATGDNLAAMRDEALRLGASTSFSASEAAVAMEILAKAGASTEQILAGATEDVMNLSAATGVDVPLAAETAATAMNIFGTSSQNAADTIAQSANASALDVNDWALALKAAGPVAASLGLDMEDLAQAMVILGDAGIKGETGGTALRNILMGLADPTGEASVGLRELGVETHNADGSFRGLEEVTHDLAAGWGEMDAAQKLQIATMVAGEQGAASFIALMDAQTAAVNDGSDAFQDASKRMDETGTASTQAQARMDNFAGSMEELKGAIETVAIEIGSQLLPAFRKVVDGATKVIRKILDLPPGVQKGIAAFVGITGALATMGGGMMLMLPRIAQTVAAFRQLGGMAGLLRPLSMAIGALTSPIGLVVLAVAALVAGFIYAYTHFEGFREVVDKVAAALKDFAENAIEKVVEAVNKLKSAFDAGGWSELFSTLGEMLLNGLQSLSDVILEGVQAIGEWFAEAFNSIDWGGVVSGAWDVLSGAGSWILDKLGDIAGGLWSWFSGAVSGVDWGGVLSTAWDVLLGASAWIIGKIGDAATLAANLFTWAWNALSGVDWMGLLQSTWSALKNVGGWVLEQIGNAATLTASLFSWAWEALYGLDWMGILQGAWSAIKNAGQWVIDMILTYHPAVLTAKLFMWAWEALQGVDWSAIFKLAIDVLKDAGQWIVDKVTLGAATAYEGMKSWASGIWQGIVDAFQPIIDTAIGLLNGLIDQLNRIPGVDIPKIGGIEDIGRDADAAATKVVSLQESLRSLATGGIFAMDDRSRAGAATGYTPYGNPYNPTEGGGGSQGGIEYTPLSDLFSGATQGATDYAAALDIANQRQGAVSDSALPMGTNLATAGTGFTTLNTEVGTTSNTLLTFVGGAAALLAGFANAVTANITTVTTSLGTVPPAILAAQTSFTTLVGAVAGLMAGFSNAVTANANLAMDTLKNRVSGATSSAKASVIELVSATVSLMAGFSNAITANVNTAMDTLKNRASGATASAKSSFIELSGSIRGSMAEATAAIWASANGWAGIIRGAGGAMNAAGLYAGSMAGAGVAQGLLNMLSSVQAAAAAIINVVTTTMAKVGEMRSPSRKTTYLGEMLGIGPAIGIENMIPKAIRAATRYTGSVLDAMRMGSGSVLGHSMPAYAYAMPAAPAPVTYHVDNRQFFALQQGEYAELLANAETGAAFAHARSKPGAMAQYLGRR